jgi:Skp family chaperone for outer membrane proteins
MKKLLSVVLFLFLISFGVSAQELKIGIVDVNKILKGSSTNNFS